MTKLITYSLFDSPVQSFEMAAYVRGFYFNARMNNLIYPDWRTHLEIDRATYTQYSALFIWLVQNNNLSLNINEDTPPLCEGMLWRMKPLFTIDVSRILCRDSDAITTYREARAVQAWMERDEPVLSINDNPSHSGLMGGMVGFDCAWLKAHTGWHSFGDIARMRDLSQRGSDQHLLNSLGIPDWCVFTPNMSQSQLLPVPPLIRPQLWESDLTCRHIGSAGVVELETIRFFQRHDAENWKFQVIEKQYPNLFYWQNA